MTDVRQHKTEYQAQVIMTRQRQTYHQTENTQSVKYKTAYRENLTDFRVAGISQIERTHQDQAITDFQVILGTTFLRSL